MQKNTGISNALYERTQAERNKLMSAAGLHNLSVEQKYLWPSLNNYFIFDPSIFFIQYPFFEVMGIYKEGLLAIALVVSLVSLYFRGKGVNPAVHSMR